MTSRFVLPYADVGSGISPSDGALLYFYDSGGNTLKDTYTTQATTVANTNPVVANASGVFPDIWIVGSYKVLLTDKNGVQQNPGEWDPVLDIGDGSAITVDINGTTVILSEYLNNQDVGGYTELRAIPTAQRVNGMTITVTNTGIAGQGTLVNSTSHGLTDNGGTIIVLDGDWYWRRTISSPVWREWFVSEQDWIDYCVTNDVTPNGKDVFRASKIWTVGASGANFTTINAALRFLSQAKIAYEAFGGDPFKTYQSINLETGFVMAEQVRAFGGMDLSWLTITATDADTSITRSALTELVGDRRPAFGAENHSHLPRIACLFTMDTSGSDNKNDGIYVFNNSSVVVAEDPGQPPIAGIRNASARGLHVQTCSTAAAENTDFSGAGDIGARIANGSTAQIRDADLSGAAGTACLAVAGSSKVNALGADCSGAASASGYGAVVAGASTLHGSNINCSGSAGGGLQVEASVAEVDGGNFEGSGNSLDGIEAINGSIVNANSATVSTNADPSARYGIFSCTGSVVTFENGTCIDPTNVGLHALNGGTICAKGATATGSGTDNIRANKAGTIDIDGATVTGATSNEIESTNGSTVNANGADATGGSVQVLNGGIVNAVGIVGSPSFNISTNTTTSSGIIFN